MASVGIPSLSGPLRSIVQDIRAFQVEMRQLRDSYNKVSSGVSLGSLRRFTVRGRADPVPRNWIRSRRVWYARPSSYSINGFQFAARVWEVSSAAQHRFHHVIVMLVGGCCIRLRVLGISSSNSFCLSFMEGDCDCKSLLVILVRVSDAPVGSSVLSA